MSMNSAEHISISGKEVVRLTIGEGLVWQRLPTGYTELMYIETTGTQYIDTGVIPNQDTRIVCEFMYFSGNGIYGARTSTASNNFALRVISGKWQPGYSILGSTEITSDTTKWHTADQNKNVFSIDGVVGREFDYVEFKAPKSIILGGINANNAVYYGSGRFRKCEIYDNGLLVRQMVPCINPDGEIGMYDFCTGTFLGNGGSGEFVGGAY